MSENLGSLNASIQIKGMDKFLDEMDTAAQKASKLEKQFRKPLELKVNSINTKGIKNAISKPLDEIEKRLKQFDKEISKENKTVTNQMVAYASRYKSQTGKDYGSDEFIKALDTAVMGARSNTASQFSLAGIYDRVEKYVSTVLNSYFNSSSSNPLARPGNSPTSVDQATIDIENLNDAKEHLVEIDSTLQTISSSVLNQNTEDLATSLVRARDQAIALRASLDTASNIQFVPGTAEGAGRFGQAMNLLKSSAQTMIEPYISLTGIIPEIQKGIQIVTDLDDAFTKMKMVSMESADKLKDFQASSFRIGNTIGASAMQIQKSAASYLQTGYRIQEAGKLAQNANLYANISGLNLEQATNYLNTSLKAFGREFNNDVSASSGIIDRYTKVGQIFSISSSEIGSAVAASAKDLADVGNTLNESLGLILTGKSLSFDSTSIGNAMKEMSMRIRESSRELQELANIDVRIDNTTFKSTAQIIKEIAKNWNGFAPTRQNDILEILAGSGQTDIIAGLIQNSDMINQITDTASDATGAALDTNEATLESITGRITLLTNQIQELWSSLIDDSTIKSAITGLTTILKFITSIVKGAGTIPVVLSTIVGLMSSKNLGRVKMLPSYEICRYNSVL